MIEIERTMNVRYPLSYRDIVDMFLQFDIGEQVNIIKALIDYSKEGLDSDQKRHWIGYFCEQMNRNKDVINFLRELANGIENVELW